MTQSNQIDKPRNEREEFEDFCVDTVYGTKDHSNAWKNKEGFTKTPEDLWHWHIQAQQRLLERVRDEVIGVDEHGKPYMDTEIMLPVQGHRNDFRKLQRSKLQSLQKEIGGEK